MSRWERYETPDGEPSRDYTYSKWHRRALPASCPMIDIDGLDYCPSCAMPLLLVEVARDVGQHIKPVTVIRAHANSANVPAIVVLYSPAQPCTCPPRTADPDCEHGIEQVRARRISPDEDKDWVQMSGRQLGQVIQRYHSSHIDAVHRKLGA